MSRSDDFHPLARLEGHDLLSDGLQPLDGDADGLGARSQRLIARLLGRPAQGVEHVERGAEALVSLRHPLGDGHEEHLQGQDAPAQVGFKGGEPLVVRRLHDGFLSANPVFHVMPQAPEDAA